ncbi:MAG: ABC transporter permease [Ruminococcaceae bacterium]|nr:ABC transporter permease [Oscillospiraceae bacterium]
MKIKLFSKDLYKEGLRQTRVVGMTYLLITFLVYLLSYTDSNLYDKNASSLLTASYELVGLAIGFVVLAPIMTLSLFHFLNTRAASDYYHSIPQSREQLFVSFFLAIQTWLTAPVLLGLLSEGIKFAVFPGVEGDFVQFITYSLSMIACNLLVSAAVLLAMNLSSTLFSQLAVSALILFLPKVLSIVFYELVHEKNEIIPYYDEAGGLFGDIFANKGNLVTSSTFDVLFGYGDSSWGEKVGPIVYTTVLALVYLAIALVLFRRRKSEKAATSATNEIVQTAIRVCISFIICLPCCIDISMQDRHFTVNIGMVFLYILAIIAYFVYELITRKTLRGFAKKMLPGLVVLVLLNVGLIFGVRAASEIIYAIPVETDNIKYVRLVYDDDTSRYAQALAADKKITNPKVIEMTADSLESTIRSERNRSFGDNYNEITVDITLDSGITIRRNISYGRDIYNLERTLYNDDSFNPLLTTLVDPDDVLEVETGHSLTQKQNKEIYELFVEEVKGLDENHRNFIFGNVYGDVMPIGSFRQPMVGDVDISYIYLTLRHNGRLMYVEYPLGFFTPKALSLYMEYANDRNKVSLEEIIAKDEDYYFDLSLTAYVPQGTSMYTHGVYFNGEEMSGEKEVLEGYDIEKYIDAVTGDKLPDDFDFSRPFVMVNYYYEHYVPEDDGFYVNKFDDGVMFLEVEDLDLLMKRNNDLVEYED